MRLKYLINQRHLHSHEDGRDPVFAATKEDRAAYYRRAGRPGR